MKLTIALLVLACCSAIYAELERGYGCPEGHAPGETWNEPGCKQCSCDDTTYVCAGCGKYSFSSDKPCYKEYDESASYPDCCTPKVICEGEPGFDASKVEA